MFRYIFNFVYDFTNKVNFILFHEWTNIFIGEKHTSQRAEVLLSFWE